MKRVLILVTVWVGIAQGLGAVETPVSTDTGKVIFGITSDNHFELRGPSAIDCVSNVFAEGVDFIVGCGDQLDQGTNTNEWETCVEAFRLNDPASPPVDLITNEPSVNSLTTLLEEQGVRIHLSGHRHRYYRSVPMTQAQPDRANGVYYIKMGHALARSNNHNDPNTDWFIDYFGGWGSYGIVTVSGDSLRLEGMHGDASGVFDTLVLHLEPPTKESE